MVILDCVFEIEKSNLQKVKDMFLKDDVVGRASVNFKEGSALGLGEKYYCYVSGVEEACKKAEELIDDLGNKVNEETEKKIIDKIKEEENQAMEGFGGIFS